MRAAWYERQGPGAEVLQVGDLPVPEPGPGEVLVRLALSGIGPGDTKKRGGWLGNPMAFPRVAPHSDGALGIPVGAVLPLTEIARAHDLVDAGAAGRVLLDVTAG